MASNVCQQSTPGHQATKIAGLDDCRCPVNLTTVVANSPLAELIERVDNGGSAEIAKRGSPTLDRRSHYVARIDQLRVETERQFASGSPDADNVCQNPPRMAAFFLVLFIFGQMTSTWAWWSGHFAAWVTGLAFSVFGISVVLISLINQTREQRRSIARLEDEIEVASSSLPKPLPFSQTLNKDPVRATA